MAMGNSGHYLVIFGGALALSSKEGPKWNGCYGDKLCFDMVYNSVAD
jgi:hypothetical protein